MKESDFLMNNKYLYSNGKFSPYDKMQLFNNGYQNDYTSIDQSYIGNVLKLNKGKRATFHVTIPQSTEWHDKVFDGIIEQAGNDHIIISNPTNGEWYLILMTYLDFVTFLEPINC